MLSCHVIENCSGLNAPREEMPKSVVGRVRGVLSDRNGLLLTPSNINRAPMQYGISFLVIPEYVWKKECRNMFVFSDCCPYSVF